MIPSEKSIAQYLWELAQREPDKKLLGNPAGWINAAQVWSAAESIALQLLAAGIRPQNYVALRAVRNIDTVLVLLALRLIGTAAVLTNPHQEPETALGDCEAPISVDAVLVPTVRNQFLLRRGANAAAISIGVTGATGFLSPAREAKKPGYVIFTSGSTGKQKAVVLSDYNLVNNLVDSQPLGCYATDDIALGVLPLEHVFGLVLLAGTAVLEYALYLPEHTDTDAILHAIACEKITRMNGVPSLYQALAESAEQHDISSLRAGFIGGAPVTADRLMLLEQQLGMTLISVYGMSECIGISCADGHDPVQLRADNVGRVYSMNEVKILSEDGTPAEPGAVGEIWVNGPARMLGYFGKPLDSLEFLPTGDMGYLDEAGNLHLSSRKKDLIIRNGRNISPRKIEDALLSLPGVRSAAVVGLPDEHTGEAPYAMVVGIIDPAELKPILPKNELPAGIMCVEELPMTFSGKPDKLRIREVLTAWKNG